MPNKQGWMSLRLTPELARQMQKLSRQNGCTVSELIRAKIAEIHAPPNENKPSNLDQAILTIEELGIQLQLQAERQEKAIKGIQKSVDQALVPLAKDAEVNKTMQTFWLDAYALILPKLFELHAVALGLTAAYEDERTLSRIKTVRGSYLNDQGLKIRAFLDQIAKQKKDFK